MKESRRALIIYTSGTTGKPKGVVLTHSNIMAQVLPLIEIWRWSDKDRILHVLPLHHMHGILNALTCAIYAGATVEMSPKFDAAKVWDRWMSPERNLSLFMAVPTIYSRLIQHYKNNIPDELKPKATESFSQFRLMISGSAALPRPIRNTWKEISGGQILLERYGMSEIGMALSHEYEEKKRFEGCVGSPLPGVQIRLISEDGKNVTNLNEVPGEIQVKGLNVFKEYWNKPEATQKEFTQDGWFKTGDIAISTKKENVFKILGRSSVDIIKSGGYKISALEIERELLSHPNILDVCVLGVEDLEWGQKIGAIVVLQNKELKMDLKVLKEFSKDKLANYKIPSLLKVIEEIPKNAMGKVNKKELVKLFK